VPHAVEAAVREELRRAGLPGQGMLARLLVLLRAAPETHLGLAAVVRMAAEIGLATTPGDLARQLDTLAEHGLLGRLLSATAEPVFDTVTEPHSHLVYEETAQIVDLRVTPETLLAIHRQVLAERPDGVEILVRPRRRSGAGERRLKIPRSDH
jgi:Fe2+ or Zn2+ uptake regulation protein